MAAYYNENDPYCVAWLRNLIAGGLIARGHVDDRDIRDVWPRDLIGYDQCHFFAGIGGWSLALRLAGWEDERPVWTGSCPCQPFSNAGRRRGVADPRHLWPEFRRLIAKRAPSVVFGEQVAGATDWLGLVRGDLEALGYAVGAMPIEAASCGADHFRDRYWFVADAHGEQQSDGVVQRGWQQCGASRHSENCNCAMADRDFVGPQVTVGKPSDAGTECATLARDRVCDVVDAALDGWGEGWTEHELRSRGFAAAVASIDGRQYVECPDGKWRRLPPSRVRWLGTRIPARVAKLRAIGNAIDPRPAATFVASYLDLVDGT